MLSRLLDWLGERRMKAALEVTGMVAISVCQDCEIYCGWRVWPPNGKQADVTHGICDPCLERHHGHVPPEAA